MRQFFATFLAFDGREEGILGPSTESGDEAPHSKASEKRTVSRPATFFGTAIAISIADFREPMSFFDSVSQLMV